MSDNHAVVVDPAAAGRLVIRAVPAPAPDRGEAIVQVRAISLNLGEVRRSILAAAGWRPGWDLAGTIERAAADGSGPTVGARVVGFLPEGAWAEQADRTLGTAVSSLATTELILENQAKGRLSRNYVVVAVRDSITDLDRESAAFLAAQPPSSRADDNRRAVTALEQTMAVLDHAATAASGDDESRRRAALVEVRQASQAVSDLHAASQSLARYVQEGAAAGGQGGPGETGGQGGKQGPDDVIDAEFEVKK